MAIFLLHSFVGCSHPETHRNVYTLSRRIEYLQRRTDTFSLSALLIEALDYVCRHYCYSIHFTSRQIFNLSCFSQRISMRWHYVIRYGV